MDVDGDEATKKDKESKEFYKTFWSLQNYFRVPSTLHSPENFAIMRKGVEAVLAKFKQLGDEQAPARGRQQNDRDRKRKYKADETSLLASLGGGIAGASKDGGGKGGDFIFPKFLTSRELFDLELRDSTFRRQILLQISIILQHLALLGPTEKAKTEKLKSHIAQQNEESDKTEAALKEEETRRLAEYNKLKPSSPKTEFPPYVLMTEKEKEEFRKEKGLAPVVGNKVKWNAAVDWGGQGAALTEEQEKWLLEARQRVTGSWEGTYPQGRQFYKTVATVVVHERNWINWKARGCDTFEERPFREMPGGDSQVKKPKFCETVTNQDTYGTPAMTQVWKLGAHEAGDFEMMQPGSNVPSFESFIDRMEDQLVPDTFTPKEGYAEGELLYNDELFVWRAYRAALRHNTNLFQGKDVGGLDSKNLGK
ncbi:hypothetical protein HDV00_000645, partial [Rhizophlyctis rosea]